MTPVLERRLDIILETSSTQVPDDPYSSATNIATELEEARRKVTDLERQLIYATDRLCGGLAMGVRKHRPGLNASIGKGCCKIGYRSKHLALRPDLTGKMWKVESSDPSFAKHFTREHAPRIALSSDLEQIAQAIAMFFGGYYKSLGEEIEGRGILLIDGRKATIDVLAEYIDVRDTFLAERAAKLRPKRTRHSILEEATS